MDSSLEKLDFGNVKSENLNFVLLKDLLDFCAFHKLHNEQPNFLNLKLLEAISELTESISEITNELQTLEMEIKKHIYYFEVGMYDKKAFKESTSNLFLNRERILRSLENKEQSLIPKMNIASKHYAAQEMRDHLKNCFNSRVYLYSVVELDFMDGSEVHKYMVVPDLFKKNTFQHTSDQIPFFLSEKSSLGQLILGETVGIHSEYWIRNRHYRKHKIVSTELPSLEMLHAMSGWQTPQKFIPSVLPAGGGSETRTKSHDPSKWPLQ